MRKALFATFAALALATPAQAQTTVDPEHILTLLKDAGYPAEYFNDDADYRQIVSKSGNYKFLVELYDCENGKACETLEFFAGFPMEKPPSKEALDAYSGPREGARIRLDRRGEPTVQLPVDLPADGLTDAQFLDRLKSWEAMMAGFVGFLKDGSAAAAAPAPATPAAS